MRLFSIKYLPAVLFAYVFSVLLFLKVCTTYA